MEMFGIIIAIGVLGFLGTTSWLVWKLFARPFAVARGIISMTAYDYIIIGWKAERRGDWPAALAAYELAIETNPHYPDGPTRRDNLLANHPELANRES